ncbi:nucleoside hydrolase [Acuticoccus mangrovi]|uniref:Nucleoside hydrolase n=1 Tax=Acuticoccus mangrovi TaxID=2796142 RepID=A0A934MBJ6_9HYPH|nr:nucleoside hydrolase [Acuticoccus mangrovi]MBJ3774192.1 nucleoside hydrolase [Acuticoccus mangrovi]
MEPTRLIIDCDPGVDDAFALALAMAAPEAIEILGITCVAGNRGLEHTERNTRRLCTLLGRTDIPVYRGCPRPIMFPEPTETKVHGVDGFGDVTSLPEPTFEAAPGHAVTFLIDTLMREPSGSVTVCTMGPMTNLAVAIVQEPRIVPRIKELVFMGGAAFRSARVRIADLNFYGDPHAAHIVVTAGIPQTMFGIDVTLECDLTEAEVERLEAVGSPACRILAEMFRAYAVGDRCVHDICPIAWLLDPTLFATVEGHIDVEHGSVLTRGITVARIHPRKLEGFTPNATIATEVERDRLVALLITRLAALPTADPAPPSARRTA